MTPETSEAPPPALAQPRVAWQDTNFTRLTLLATMTSHTSSPESPEALSPTPQPAVAALTLEMPQQRTPPELNRAPADATTQWTSVVKAGSKARKTATCSKKRTCPSPPPAPVSLRDQKRRLNSNLPSGLDSSMATSVSDAPACGLSKQPRQVRTQAPQYDSLLSPTPLPRYAECNHMYHESARLVDDRCPSANIVFRLDDFGSPPPTSSPPESAAIGSQDAAALDVDVTPSPPSIEESNVETPRPLSVASGPFLDLPLQTQPRESAFQFQFELPTPMVQTDALARPFAPLPRVHAPPPSIAGPYTLRDIPPHMVDYAHALPRPVTDGRYNPPPNRDQNQTPSSTSGQAASSRRHPQPWEGENVPPTPGPSRIGREHDPLDRLQEQLHHDSAPSPASSSFALQAHWTPTMTPNFNPLTGRVSDGASRIPTTFLTAAMSLDAYQLYTRACRCHTMDTR